MYGTITGYRTLPADDGVKVKFTFTTDDGQDIEVCNTVLPGDDLLKIANGDRFTANKAMTDMGQRIPVDLQRKAAEAWKRANSFEPWKRAEFRSDAANVQFAAECGWRYDDNDMLRKIAR